MSKTAATIEITGVGPVQINTELKEVRLVRALTASGDYVNVVKKKVSRNQKAAKKAAKKSGKKMMSKPMKKASKRG